MLDPSLSIEENLRELEPDEIAYLRRVCNFLKTHPIPTEVLDPDFEYFDPDELGIDPEEDYEQWE